MHQLRKAGYRIAPLRGVMTQLGRTPGSGDIGAALTARDQATTARSRALLDATAALTVLLSLQEGLVSARAKTLPRESRNPR